MLDVLKKVYHNYRINSRIILDYVFGNKNYKKFVIICDSRTGSTLLLNMLGFHPEIEVEGERFKNINKRSGIDIWNSIFRKRQARIKYVGFKLFYFHSQGEDKSVWDSLNNDKSITIIHLRRENMFRSLVSKKIGLNTKQWTENINSKKNIDLSKKKVEIDINECESYFNQISSYQSQTDEAYKNHKLIPILYEDLSSNPRLVIDQLYLKLGVKGFKRNSELKKQNPEKLSELIINYNELKQHFNNSKWDYLFNEN